MKFTALTRYLIFSAIILLCAGWSTGSAQEAKLISVNGKGELKIKPDQVYVSLQIRSFDKDLANARLKNEQDLDAITKIIYEFDVDRKSIEIYFLRFDPDYKNWEKEKIKGYSITKSVSFILNDVSKIEDILSRLLEAGADQFYSIELRSSKKSEYEIQARKLALEKALKKAEAMANQMGVKIGKVHSIFDFMVTEPIPEINSINKYVFAARGGRSYPNAYDSNVGGDFMGMISIEANVNVSFELEQQ